MEQKLGSVYEKFQVILSDVMRSAVKAGLDDIDSELEKLRDILRSGQPKVNCTRCRSVADTCVSQLMSIEKAKLLPPEHGRPDLNTYLRSLREHYKAKQEDEGILAVAHGHLIRELGNAAAHGNSSSLSEFDSITALGATCRFAEFTVARKVAMSGSSSKSPDVAPNQMHFPPLQSQPQQQQQPQMPPSIGAAMNAAAAVQMQQIMAQAAQQQQQQGQQRSQQWFPAASGVAYMNPGMMPMMQQPQYYHPQQQQQPQQYQQPPVQAKSQPQQQQQREAYIPASVDSFANSEAHGLAPSIRASSKAPSAAVGGSFAALASQNDEDDDKNYDESLLAPDEGAKSKPSAPAGKAALRAGPIGPEVRPSGAPIKPKFGARLPHGPPREPGDAAPQRPGRRRNRKNRKVAQNGPQSQQQQVKEQNVDEEDLGDEEEVDTNVELLDESLLLTAEEDDSNYLAVCGLDPDLDPDIVWMTALEMGSEISEYRHERLPAAGDEAHKQTKPKLFMYFMFEDAEHANIGYQKLQWETFSGKEDHKATCYFIRSFPQHLS